jgi:hypothetical protein
MAGAVMAKRHGKTLEHFSVLEPDGRPVHRGDRWRDRTTGQPRRGGQGRTEDAWCATHEEPVTA